MKDRAARHRAIETDKKQAPAAVAAVAMHWVPAGIVSAQPVAIQLFMSRACPVMKPCAPTAARQ